MHAHVIRAVHAHPQETSCREPELVALVPDLEGVVVRLQVPPLAVAAELEPELLFVTTGGEDVYVDEAGEVVPARLPLEALHLLPGLAHEKVLRRREIPRLSKKYFIVSACVK